MGLHRAGFDVVGVDIVERNRYPFPFIKADALTADLAGYDFIWASPPCQGYTELRHAPGTRGAPMLIDAVRKRMPVGVPWCIENVEDAQWAMRDPITLCGSMFGLEVAAHRVTEMTNAEIHMNAERDPDIFRDVARALLSRIRTNRRLNRLTDMGFKDAADAARESDSY